MTRKYYEAYEDRYKTAHAKGVSWSSDKNSPIVLDTIKKYKLNQCSTMLEIGCGEGRDSKAVLDKGYNLVATDISKEAVAYCKKNMPSYKNHFQVLDCINDYHEEKYDFIYSVAVIHMLVLKEEMQSDISNAFTLQEREHESGKMVVAGTSCRMVSFETFEKEIKANHLKITEKGITSALPDFNNLMFAVVKKG